MDDLISRQLLISKLANSTVKFATYDDWEHCCDVIESVERKKGEWIDFSMSIKGIPTEACGECGEWSYGMGKNYCPNCGADMRKEVKS